VKSGLKEDGTEDKRTRSDHGFGGDRGEFKASTLSKGMRRTKADVLSFRRRPSEKASEMGKIGGSHNSTDDQE
jgi:hypothetical protein